ncbi:HEAT repeat domain-containing protein [Nocardia cyriacigeorgica]|uniref:HEAT repeat domain-containing protein n=1 Tax=Nocardia cyriacigeorgica TaxID=135487 RepID=A0A5R8P458_9NOCA|nr:HEAT repeat domain-containing protein [Nocardia cyriacigeorgica]TLF92252.1 HEAT repeat domain-containing protein [Nocardia cyriacigeorgica]
MTPEDKDAIMSLVNYPGRVAGPEDRQAVLAHFGTADGVSLGLDLLERAASKRDIDDLELALIVCFAFGVTNAHLSVLLELSQEDWHRSHEDIVSKLGELTSPDSVTALRELAEWVPAYLEYDESRALARKAIWAIGGIPGPEAEGALIQLAGSDDEIVRKEAKRQLDRRSST